MQQHDAQLDYYGRRLATASSDRTIKLFDVEGDLEYRLIETLRAYVQFPLRFPPRFVTLANLSHPTA